MCGHCTPSQGLDQYGVRLSSSIIDTQANAITRVMAFGRVYHFFTLQLQETHVFSTLAPIFWSIEVFLVGISLGWKVYENEQNEWKTIAWKVLIIFQRRTTQNSSCLSLFIVFISFYHCLSLKSYSFQKV